jgi:hypothetical protein
MSFSSATSHGDSDPKALSMDTDTTYGSLGVEWRKEEVLACEAVSALEAFVDQLTGVLATSLEALQTLVKALTQKRSDCQKLSERVFVKYSSGKKENAELRAQVADMETMEKKKDHAVTKAKEYRVQVKILEKKLLQAGGSLDGLKQETVKSLKRSREETAPEENHQAPMLHPQKRVKTGPATEPPSTPDAYSPRVHNTAPKQLQSPAPTITPSKRTPAPAPPPSHMTAIPRAKRSSFTKEIPLGMEKKFAKKRLPRPNRLHDPTNASSFVTSVLQSLAAYVKTHDVYKGLTAEEQKTPDFPYLSNKRSVPDMKKVLFEHRKTTVPKALVDFLAYAQYPDDTPLNTYPIYKHVLDKGSRAAEDIKEPVKYMNNILTHASTPNLDHAFKAPHSFHMECSECHAVPAPEQNTLEKKTYLPPTTETEEAWLTPLKPEYTPREHNYAGRIKRTLLELLGDKQRTENYTGCPKCRRPNASRLRKTWLGFAYAPEVMTFSFDRAADKKYAVTLPLEADFKPFVVASGEKTGYRLVSAVKKMKGGEYAAFVHAEDGKWGRCVSGKVERCEVRHWQHDAEKEDVVLAVYEKLE